MKSLHNPKLYELLAERQLLLEQNPELAKVQEEIDNTLSTAGSQHNRMVLLQKLMLSSVADLQDKLKDLEASVKQLRGD